VCCVNGEKWCAFCPEKAACAFCVATALLARSDTRVYLARRRLAAIAKITYRFTGEEQNAHHGFTRLAGFQPNKAKELRKGLEVVGRECAVMLY